MNSTGSFSPSVLLWMHDIRLKPDVEHVTLQTKSIQGAGSVGRSPVLVPATCRRPVPSKYTLESGHSTRNPLISTAHIRLSAESYISSQMEQSVLPVSGILKELLAMKSPDLNSSALSSRFLTLTGELSAHLVKMCDDSDRHFFFPYCEKHNPATVATGRDIVARIRQQIARLTTARLIAQCRGSLNFSKRQKEIINVISDLHGQFLEQVVLMDCQMLVKTLHKSVDTIAFVRAASAMSDFANRGNNIRRLFCQADAITSLLNSNVLSDVTESMRVASLRCLANICCHPNAILKLEKEGNFQKLIALIWINENSNAVRCETAGVLAQVAVHLQPSRHKSDELAEAAIVLLDSLIDAIPAVIRALIHVIRNVKDEETLLVVAACLANLSFLHSVTPVLEILCHQDCMSSLLLAWRNGYAKSLFTKNQITGAILGLSMQNFGQEYLLQQPSLSEFFIDVLNQCLPENSNSPAENGVRSRVTRRSLMVLGGLLKQEKFRLTFLKAQGIIVYQTVLGQAKRGLLESIPSETPFTYSQ